MHEIQRRIINALQGGFPVCSHPFAIVAENLGIEESQLMDEIASMLESGLLTRFGPLYNVERMGGVLSLVAMRIPQDDFDRVVELVNRHPEVAHNYARDHAFNLWFVIATDHPERKSSVLAEIEKDTGYPAYDMPKEDEYFVGIHFSV